MPSESFRRQREEMQKNVPRSVVDYSGHIPVVAPVLKPPSFDPSAFHDAVSQGPVVKSPIQTLIDEMMDKTNEAREELLRKLIEDPGIVATFNNDFVVEFADLEFEPIDSPEDRGLDEYRIAITQKWRIRRRKEEDGPAGTPLGRDS